MTKKKKIIILSSSIALGAALIALLITLLSVNSVNSNTKEELYQKGLTHLINQEYKDATEVFADNLLIGYKDSEKKYCYSYDLLKYEQHSFEYEDLIDYGLSEPNSLAIVDFTTGEGTKVPRKTISEKVDKPYITETSSKTNYDFLGWNLTYASYDKDNDAIYYILEANFDNHYFKIEYDFAGGQSETVAPSHYQYNKGDVSIPNAVKTGYIFDGYESNLFEGKVKDFVIPKGTAKDLTLTATYHAKTVEVTFDASPAANPDPISVKYDENVTAKFPADPSVNYYHFDGWFNGITPVNLEKFNFDHDVELKAKYSPINYEIVYDLQGGTPAKELPTSYNAESSFGVLPFVEKEGKIFVGWTDSLTSNPSRINYTFPVGSPCNIVLTANFVDATITSNKLMSINNTEITEFVLPTFVNKVDSSVLRSLEKLESIYIDERNEHFTMENGLLVEDNHIAVGYPAKFFETTTDIILPTSIDQIGEYTFRHTPITSLDITNSVHLLLNDHMFDGCIDLRTIRMRHGQIVTRMADVFSMCGKITSVEYIIDACIDNITIKKHLFANLNNVEEITIKYIGTDEKTIVLGQGAFLGDARLVDVVLDNCKVTDVPDNCFNGCTSFKNSSGAFSNLNSYGEGAFFSCTQLDTMSLTGTTSIGRVAFAGCYSLCSVETLTVPATVATLGEEAFDDIVGEIYIDLTESEVNALTVPGGAWDRFNAGFAGVITYKS